MLKHRGWVGSEWKGYCRKIEIMENEGNYQNRLYSSKAISLAGY